jgi:hypothetical protein
MVSVFDPEAKEYRRLRFGPGAPSDDARFGPVALDPRRRRLFVVGRENAMLSVYSLDSGTTDNKGPVGKSAGPRSITYSPHDDCFYSLGPAPAQTGNVMTITRITPDGTPLWQIPVGERVGDSTSIGQLYTAGQYLVIVTPSYVDPLAPAAPWQRRCVVLDPVKNTVVYSGPMAPHPGHD